MMSRWACFLFSSWLVTFFSPEFCGRASLCLVGLVGKLLVGERLPPFHWGEQFDPDCLPLRPPHQLWDHLWLQRAGGRQQPGAEHPHRRPPHPLLPGNPCHAVDALAPQVRFLQLSQIISFESFIFSLRSDPRSSTRRTAENNRNWSLFFAQACFLILVRQSQVLLWL